jgi:alpha-ketoglutarate-dependent taurine dioxygenase
MPDGLEEKSFMDSNGFSLTPLCETFGLMIEAPAREPIETLAGAEIVSLFKEHGALLFRNFAVDTKGFLDFTSRYCRDFSTYQGGGFRWGSLDREKIDNNETLLSVTGSTQSFGIPLHGEMYYMRHKPTLLWFYCEHPPLQAGETTLCDGKELYRQMSEDERAYFSEHRLKYVRHLTDDEWRVTFQTEDLEGLREWCARNDSTLAENADGSVTIEYVCPAVCTERDGSESVFINNLLVIHSAEQAIRDGAAAKAISLPRNACPIVVRLENDAEIPSTLVQQIERTANDLSLKVAWRAGDILMIDNTRILHGRKKCLDTARNIYVRMGEPAFAF